MSTTRQIVETEVQETEYTRHTEHGLVATDEFYEDHEYMKTTSGIKTWFREIDGE